uniref:Uncharacterized protein n=1 Tax=Biomphalaria glabrata TaxID=6526 RepID=A0A2C9LIX4_BIOGL
MMNLLSYGILVWALGIVGNHGQDALLTSDGSASLASVYEAIDATTTEAREGIKASELEAAMDDIRNKANEYLNGKSAKVERQDIVNLLADVTSKYNQGIALSTLLEDPLVQEDRKVSAGLYTLNELSRRLKKEGNETSINTLVASVQFTAGAIRGMVLTVESIYTYNMDVSNNENNSNKRLTKPGPFDGGYRGPYWAEGVRRQNVLRRLSKRPWSAGLSGGYSQGGGFNVGASVSYSWR